MDLLPGLESAEKQARMFYAEFGKNLFTYSSLPAVSVAIAFDNYLNKAGVNLFVPTKQTYLDCLSVPAGQSILITMEAIGGLTPIRQREFGASALIAQSAFSWDGNLLYDKF